MYGFFARLEKTVHNNKVTVLPRWPWGGAPLYPVSRLHWFPVRCCLAGCHSQGALSIQPKIPEILVGTSNGTDHFGLVQPEYLGPALRVVRFDQSGHFSQSDLNVPFHLTKLLFPVPLFCILFTRIITKHVVAWVRSVQPECTIPLGTRNFRNLKPEFLLNGKRPGLSWSWAALDPQFPGSTSIAGISPHTRL